MQTVILALVATGAFWRASEEVTETEFASFARAIRQRQDHLELLAWVPRASRDGREVHEVRFIEPSELMSKVAGVDLGFDPERRSAFERARSTGREHLTGPIRLIHAGDAGAGLLMVMPVPQAAGAAGPEGFVVATLLVVRLLEHALGDLRDAGIDVEMADGGPEGSGRIDRPLALRRAPVERSRGEPLRHEDTFVLGGRTWMVHPLKRQYVPVYVMVKDSQYFCDKYGFCIVPDDPALSRPVSWTLLVNGTMAARINLIMGQSGGGIMTTIGQNALEGAYVGSVPAQLQIALGNPTLIIQSINTGGSGLVVPADSSLQNWNDFVRWAKYRSTVGRPLVIATVQSSIQEEMIREASAYENITVILYGTDFTTGNS